MPIISDKIPTPCRNLRAGDIMSDTIVCFKMVDSVENIKEVLLSNNHHAYPLVNSSRRLVGLIPRNYIIVIIKNKGWFNQERYGSQSINEVVSINEVERTRSTVISNFQDEND
jgi:CBS-domain-containing membrane protein